MSRFYIGFFALMTLAGVAFAGVVIPQLSEQSIARNHKETNENNNNKLTICHIPPDNPDNPQTIVIKRSALQDHLDHGDLECACDPDGDGVLCDVDQCDEDPNKTEPGVCGCGVADTDSDGDNVADCNDACPNDPDNDADGDGACGDVDGCPNDANKTDPGQCGCGNPDTDTDQDTIADCNDVCPNDPDNDADGDGVCGDVDGCPADPNKTEQGQCGCGNPDTDTDGDNTADCNDGCDNDPNKTEPGVCDCGTPDDDTDSDGIADCNDQCPGQADDADMDGYLSCVDDCNDSDPGVNPGELLDVTCDGIDSDCSEGLGGCEPLCEFNQCLGKACRQQVSDGCGGTYTCGRNIDNDEDGVNCLNDACDNDPGKTNPGFCGCGVSDAGAVDNDGDNCYSCVDCNDNNPNIRPNNCQGDGIIKTEGQCDGIDSDCSEGLGGCEPLSENSLCCAKAGVGCGTIPDGCGGTIDCGECGSVESCIYGSCCSDLLTICTSGVSCGFIRNACGSFSDCGPCPEGLACDEETNLCEDPCDPDCGAGFLCDLNTLECVNDPEVCVPDCRNPAQGDFTGGECGDPDGCGGTCTFCSNLNATCITDEELANYFSLQITGETADAFCVPLCREMGIRECGPCLDCDTTCVISEKKSCPSGETCISSLIGPQSIGWTCFDISLDPEFACKENRLEPCSANETCKFVSGIPTCQCCATDILGNEVCEICDTESELCSFGHTCCSLKHPLSVCFE